MEQAKTKSLEAEEKEKELNAKILQCKKAIRTWISDIAEGDNALEKNIWQQINENKLVEHRDAVKVDVNYMFSILHYYGRNLLKRHFCMEILKKVHILLFLFSSSSSFFFFLSRNLCKD